MKSLAKGVCIVGAVAVAFVLGTAAAQSKKTVFVDSGKAQFKDVVPGVKKVVLWGDHDAGPYGAFTKFEPGLTNAMHTHTSDLRIVVLQGAYIYKPQNGEEKRVGAGSYISIPGGDVHVSGGDPKEGALFYEESSGKFDIKFLGKK